MEYGGSHGPSPWGVEVWFGWGVLPGLRVVELEAVAVTVTPAVVVASVPRN